MDQTRGIDRSRPIMDQIIEVLDKRYYVEESEDTKKSMDILLGGRHQLHKKTASAILSLTSDYFFKNQEKLKPYVED